MNIVDAYLKYNGQYIILVSGFSGSGKTNIAQFIAKIFKFKLMKLENYEYGKDVYDKADNYVKLNNDVEYLDWDNIHKSVDWSRLNKDISEIKSKSGIVLSGFGFPISKIEFKPDLHLHIKISKQTLGEKRKKYFAEHPEDPFNKLNKKVESTITLALNTVSYPHYMEIIKESKIDKFINANELDETQIKDEIFSYLMHHTNKFLDSHFKSNSNTNSNTNSERVISRPQNINTQNYGQNTFENNMQNITQNSMQNIMQNNAQYVYGLQNNEVLGNNLQDYPLLNPRALVNPNYLGNSMMRLDTDKAPTPSKNAPLKNPEYEEYYPTERKRYDFDENGIDYPKPYEEEFRSPDFNELPSASGSDTEEIEAGYAEMDENASSSDSLFIGTFREDNPDYN